MESASLLQDLARDSAALDEEVAQKFAGLTSDQMNWRKDGIEWSVGQEFDHLLRTNRPYLDELERVFEKAGPARPDFKPSFWGKFIYKAAKPGSRFAPVPPILVPTAEPVSPDVVAEYLHLQKRFDALLEQAKNKDLSAKLTSPIASFVKMRVGDALRITVVHNRRHMEKAERLRTDSGFPR